MQNVKPDYFLCGWLSCGSHITLSFFPVEYYVLPGWIMRCYFIDNNNFCLTCSMLHDWTLVEGEYGRWSTKRVAWVVGERVGLTFSKQVKTYGGGLLTALVPYNPLRTVGKAGSQSSGTETWTKTGFLLEEALTLYAVTNPDTDTFTARNESGQGSGSLSWDVDSDCCFSAGC